MSNQIRSFFLAAVLLWIMLSLSIYWWRYAPKDNTVAPEGQKEVLLPQPHVIYTNLFEGQVPSDSFSACIMFKDDTHRLTEWLAYHYHVLPLRQVIIGVDVGSKAYPVDVADRYANRMKVTVWPKDVFAPESEMKVSDRKKNMDGANQYIRKQTLFLRKCALELQRQGRGWTIFVDPDEYLVFNYPAGTTPPPTVQEDFRGVVMPSMREGGSVYKFLQQEAAKGASYANPCITVPRLLFGNQTSATGGPSLDTLRYRSHASIDNYKSNRQAKNLLDLQRFKPNQLNSLKNVHRMVPDVCWNSFLTSDKSLFKVNHYIGSKESFFHRQDDRDQYGRRDNYDKFASIADGTDDTITTWYDGFKEQHGQEVADMLLEGAAIPF